MEVTEALTMNGGTGDNSYSRNSIFQKGNIHGKAHKRRSYNRFLLQHFRQHQRKYLCIADLGCSSGTNTLFVVTELMKTVDKVRLKHCHQSPQFQIYLNDLPGNDFNTIFLSLPKFQENLKQETGSGFGPCFLNGVPGSFYGRLFPSKSLHFIHSSFSLHWISQVPDGVHNNKGNVYISSSSPDNVLKAYLDQFQKDFSVFLKCRSHEIVDEGRMVLTFLGRRSNVFSSKECCATWDLLSVALNDMVVEGIIEEGKMDSFNVPYYTPSPNEVKSEVEKEGSFIIDHFEVSELTLNACSDGLINDSKSSNGEFDGYNVAKCMRGLRAIAEPLLVRYLGESNESIIDELFTRYKKILVDYMSREEIGSVNLTLSLIKRT